MTQEEIDPWTAIAHALAVARHEDLEQAAEAMTRDLREPTCTCEKVDRCLRDLCPQCCYCGAQWQQSS
jgi:hypothetical protein